jgi:hypothetical protein
MTYYAASSCEGDSRVCICVSLECIFLALLWPAVLDVDCNIQVPVAQPFGPGAAGCSRGFLGQLPFRGGRKWTKKQQRAAAICATHAQLVSLQPSMHGRQGLLLNLQQQIEKDTRQLDDFCNQRLPGSLDRWLQGR